MSDWTLASTDAQIGHFSDIKHILVSIPDFLKDPGAAISDASLQNFARITPQYPGIRASLSDSPKKRLTEQLSPLLSDAFEMRQGTWSIMAWYSLVTSPPSGLLPIQRLPHVDGTDPNQIAMMLYLHETDHGGTAFFRHRSTGLEALTQETYPRYRDTLQAEVEKTGMPPARYVTDGAPLFEVTHNVAGNFNEAVFYRGNILHSGVIENDVPLPSDPCKGRLTLNAFLRPPQ
ncbi:Tryptophan 7-halogenase [Altererythrobacter insulae]|nr:Tryptophan 7-halogenase [Altererythrobacter insulae]